MSITPPTDSTPLPVKVVRPSVVDGFTEVLKGLPAGVGMLFLVAWIVMLIAGSLGLTQFGYWQVLLAILAIRLIRGGNSHRPLWTWKNGADK